MQNFKNDVDEGLSRPEKRLNSKYFYDEIGDDLFVQIMNMPEYYLTNAEKQIFSTQSDDIINSFAFQKSKFQLIELGAGDGLKTMVLIERLLERSIDFTYHPIDISQNALDGLESKLKERFPQLDVQALQGEYFEVLSKLQNDTTSKVILFLGSNLGNLEDEQATLFLSNLSQNLIVGDKLLLGVDLIKDRSVVLPAYDDAKGITRKFNMNLLTRINRELDGDFDLDSFDHHPTYDQKEGIMRSYIVSKKNQHVSIGALNKSFGFEKDEAILVEISRKYNDQIIQKLIGQTRLRTRAIFKDEQNLFANYIFEKE